MPSSDQIQTESQLPRAVLCTGLGIGSFVEAEINADILCTRSRDDDCVINELELCSGFTLGNRGFILMQFEMA